MPTLIQVLDLPAPDKVTLVITYKEGSKGEPIEQVHHELTEAEARQLAKTMTTTVEKKWGMKSEI